MTNQSTRKFFKTTYIVEVLSEEKIPEDMDLLHVVEQGVEGEYSLMVKDESTIELDAIQTAKELETQGSDPSFFRLTEDGQEVEGW